MDRLFVLSSFEQCTDVSKRGCSELSSLGVHFCELQVSGTKYLTTFEENNNVETVKGDG